MLQELRDIQGRRQDVRLAVESNLNFHIGRMLAH
jgi:hypothetical protein